MVHMTSMDKGTATPSMKVCIVNHSIVIVNYAFLVASLFFYKSMRMRYTSEVFFRHPL